MILSMASDLQTRRIVWAGRKTETAQQTMGQDLPLTVESEWIAGAYSDRWHDEAIAALPLFTHADWPMKKIERERLMIMTREGWAEKRRTGGHIVWQHPRYGTTTTSATPSDINSLRQIERQLRRIAAAAAWPAILAHCPLGGSYFITIPLWRRGRAKSHRYY